MIMTGKKIYNSDGRSSEDKALDKFAEMIIEKIKTLQNDWKKPWFTDKSISWPRNLSGREYNGMNALLLMMHCEKQGYKLPVFCTFDRVAGLNYTKDKQGVRQQIKDNNGQELPKVSILKGEKSFPVFITTFTVVNKETKEKIKYDEYKQLSEEEKKGYNVYPKLQVYNVFNVAQTNLQEARPDLYKKLADAGKQISLHTQEIFLDRRLIAYVCDPLVSSSLDNGFCDIYTVGRKFLLRGRYEICCGDSYCPAQLPAMDDLAFCKIRITQKLIYLFYMPLVQFFPYIGTADISALILLFFQDFCIKSIFFS